MIYPAPMQEFLIPVLIATAGGIIASGLLFWFGSWLRALLRLPNDPPPELADLPGPPPEHLGTAQERRTLNEARQRCGAIVTQLTLWQATIESALAAIPHLPTDHVVASRRHCTGSNPAADGCAGIIAEVVKKLQSSLEAFWIKLW